MSGPYCTAMISRSLSWSQYTPFAADAIALALAELGSISERRQALLIDASLSGLPPFLTENSGLHSGFMMTQVTAAALVSENKSLSVPASVDSRRRLLAGDLRDLCPVLSDSLRA